MARQHGHQLSARSCNVSSSGCLRKLTHAVVINVSYPAPINGRGTVDVPEVRVGAATLPLLVSLIHQYRPDCEVRMYDEIGTPVDWDFVDQCPREQTLILLSVRTSLAYESRELARQFQALGFAVVMGGPHVSACLDEVVTYANAAVHGEAELHMPAIIAAFEAGALRATTLPGLRFRSSATFDLQASPAPAFSLYVLVSGSVLHVAKAADRWASCRAVDVPTSGGAIWHRTCL